MFRLVVTNMKELLSRMRHTALEMSIFNVRTNLFTGIF